MIASSGSTPPPDLQEAIRRRAEEIFTRTGKLPGRDLQNWAQAESEILREFSAVTRRFAVVVKVDGVQYVGEYSPSASGGYHPGEFGAGAPVPVRFEGEKMFIIRANGQELETTVVNRIG
jgi:hypothetical protein